MNFRLLCIEIWYGYDYILEASKAVFRQGYWSTPLKNLFRTHYLFKQVWCIHIRLQPLIRIEGFPRLDFKTHRMLILWARHHPSPYVDVPFIRFYSTFYLCHLSTPCCEQHSQLLLSVMQTWWTINGMGAPHNPLMRNYTFLPLGFPQTHGLKYF